LIRISINFFLWFCEKIKVKHQQQQKRKLKTEQQKEKRKKGEKRKLNTICFFLGRES